MDIFASTDHARDLPKTRQIETNTVPFLIEQKDPHGFWYVRRASGQVPYELQGAYTTYEYADQAVRRYLARNPKAEAGRPERVKLEK